MGSVSPRISFYDRDDVDVEQERLFGDNHDGRTPLDKTIDRIGMGSYQWALLSLCGFGWMADNMWIQAIAIILPRVQQHYSVPDSYIGTVSSTMFAGMMVGAIGWGTCSDLMGRSTAFNATLFFTAFFGILASFVNSFGSLCVVLFFLGSSVGGSMPTDGTLLLEHMPKEKQYLVTALSIFFSFGAVLSAFVALIVLPNHSCPPSPAPCDVASQNQGWQYLLGALGVITLSMFFGRIILFRLHESPRYLVHAGRPQDAIKSLQMISRFNGSELSIELDDVRDHHYPITEVHSPPNRPESPTVFDAGVIDDPRRSLTDPESGNSSRSALVTDYASTGESPKRHAHPFNTPVMEAPPPLAIASMLAKEIPPSPSAAEYTPRPNAREVMLRRSSTASGMSSIYSQSSSCRFLPRWLRRPLASWWSRVTMVLAPEWLRTTILVWSAWCAMSLAYTMFNVFLPKLLETRKGADSPQTLEESLWDVAIFTMGGCPGALLGAYLVETPLGRRWSLAGSTFITAFFCAVFVLVSSTWAVRATTVGISLSATTMWAVLYGWTPEIFGTKVRGTACGIASALSRIGGMIAPLLGGILLMLDRSIPVYTSVIIFTIAGLCVLLLREGEGDSGRGKGKGAKTFLH